MRAFWVYLGVIVASFGFAAPRSGTQGLPGGPATTHLTDPVPPKESFDEGSSPCQLDQIMPRTNQRQQEFVENVNRIGAIEVLVHERLGKDGKAKEHQRKKFNYVAVVEDVRPGSFNLNEYRDGHPGISGFPGDLATLGMPSLALIFHPYHQDEFEMTCEGLSSWHDRPAWQVHFSQRKDRPARMSAIRVGYKTFPVLLMGTAWIDSESFQIVHLETDLLQPIPEVRLLTEHQVLDYGPVHFEGRDLTLWLPKDADILLYSDGKRFHHRHTYTHYQIFSVDYGQTISDPKQSPSQDPPQNPSP